IVGLEVTPETPSSLMRRSSSPSSMSAREMLSSQTACPSASISLRWFAISRGYPRCRLGKPLRMGSQPSTDRGLDETAGRQNTTGWRLLLAGGILFAIGLVLMLVGSDVVDYFGVAWPPSRRPSRSA